MTVFVQSAFQGLRLLSLQFAIHQASLFCKNLFIYSNRDRSRTPTTSKLRRNSLYFAESRLVMSQRAPYQILRGLQIWLGTMYKSNLDKQFPVLHVLYYFQEKKRITEVENFELVCLEESVLETAQTALDNIRGARLKYRVFSILNFSMSQKSFFFHLFIYFFIRM